MYIIECFFFKCLPLSFRLYSFQNTNYPCEQILRLDKCNSNNRHNSHNRAVIIKHNRQQ